MCSQNCWLANLLLTIEQTTQVYQYNTVAVTRALNSYSKGHVFESLDILYVKIISVLALVQICGKSKGTSVSYICVIMGCKRNPVLAFARMRLLSL